MRIERLAAEVREEIGLIGPIDPKVLAVWLGLELRPVPYPTGTGLVGDPGRPGFLALEYSWNQLEHRVAEDIAVACAEYVFFTEDVLSPSREQARFLAALLCDPESLVLIPT